MFRGHRVPWTHSRAIAFLYQNVPSDRTKRFYKKQAKREEKRYLKSELKKEIDSL